ncbi:hypothetical protein MMC12_006429 [Toensbergia leucococca]|nr:hypothetical protein [Toensbergia leucococca]
MDAPELIRTGPQLAYPTTLSQERSWRGTNPIHTGDVFGDGSSDYEDDPQHESWPGIGSRNPNSYAFVRPRMPQRQRMAASSERPPSPPRRRHPRRRRSEHRQPSERETNPSIILDEISRERSSWDTYKYHADPSIPGYRRGELHRSAPAIPPNTWQPGSFHEGQEERYDPQLHQHYPPRPPIGLSRPRAPLQHIPPYGAHQYTPQRNYSHMKPHDTQQYLPQDSPPYLDIGSNTSSSEEDKEWTGAEHSDPGLSPNSSPLLSYENASPARSPIRLNGHDDDDLLNPSDWNRKLQITESSVRENHYNRNSWPTTWRHSDSKTCPKSLEPIWKAILDVDYHIKRLGLDETSPMINNSKYHSKRKGTLAEVVAAYNARSRNKAEKHVSTSSPTPALTPISDSWDSACHQVQRLVKARDYLILVCRDAEFLNKIHPTMDAITWFEQAESVNKLGVRRIRSQVIELMSVSLSHLARIIASLNLILQALLWGWSDRGDICIDPDEDTTDTDFSSFKRSRQAFIETARSEDFVSKRYENGEKRIQTCIHTLEIGLDILMCEVEVFSAILSKALYYQCDVHISSNFDSGPEIEIVNYGRHYFPGLFFQPRGLECMSSFIQGRDIWVLMQYPTRSGLYFYVSPTVMDDEMLPPLSYISLSHIRTTITDLTRIWGPIWTASGLQDENIWIWYRLPSGYIGAPERRREDMIFESDESPCHFSTDVGDFGTCPSARFFVPDLPYLLIGHGLPAALIQHESCQTDSKTGLEGMALQPIGTLKPFKYKDSSAFNINVGWGGTSASWSTQIKTNPGVVAKESLLQRWRLEPEFRNARLLLLWYGVEVSLCTRNARRCRLIDLLRSHTIIRYLTTAYQPKLDSTACKSALFDALRSPDPNAFIELYKSHLEWRAELGAMVARCLDVLEQSGVDRNGNLAVFTFIEKYHDPEHLAILSKKEHTWIGLLKDSQDTAVFAIASDRCLEYLAGPVQNCRRRDGIRYESKTVLETSYTSTSRSGMLKLFRQMRVNDQLMMQNSGKFKIKKRSPRGILLGTWSDDPLRYFHIPRASDELYQERRQDGEQAIRAIVVSKRRQRLIRLREPPKAEPVISEVGDVFSHTGSRNTSPLPENDKDLVEAISPTAFPQSVEPDQSTAEGPSRSREISIAYIDTSTQTDVALIHQRPSTTLTPAESSEYLLTIDSKKRTGSPHHKSRYGSDGEINLPYHRHRSKAGSSSSLRSYRSSLRRSFGEGFNDDPSVGGSGASSSQEKDYN